MKKNMGDADRVIRIVIAAMLAIVFFAGGVPLNIGIGMLIVAGVLLLTSFLGFCPLYWIFGINTDPLQKNEKKK